MNKKVGKVFDITLEGEGWSGTVSIRLLPYNERLNMAKDMDKEGENSFDQATRFQGILKDNIEALDVTHEKGATFNEIDDLEYYEEGTVLMGKLIPLLVKGVPLGNVLKLTSNEAQPTQ